jgi:hypothetical protein
MMKMKMKSAVLALALGTLTAGAWAAEVGSPSTATTTFAVNNPGVVSHTLTAGAPLVAGPAVRDQIVARGDVSVSDQGNAVAIRFTPATCDQISNGYAEVCEFSGINDNENKLRLWLAFESTLSSDGNWRVSNVNGDDWYSIKVDQNTPQYLADSYNVSVDAVEWQN